MAETPQSLSISNTANGHVPMTPPHQSAPFPATTASASPPPSQSVPNAPGNSETREDGDLASVIASVHRRVYSFLSESHPPDSLLAAVQRQTRTSLDIVKDALARYRLSELSLSYNGGKDCLVLLIIFLAGLHEHYSSRDPGPQKASGNRLLPISTIPAIYALPPDPFPDVEEFVQSSSRMYHLSVTKYTTNPPCATIRSCFESYLSLNPGIRAIFVGTRRTDPHGEKLTHFDQTDHGWPNFMRIHPVIDWHYAEIWAFIRHLRFEYCRLYDQGYTSLGGKTDTHPNPRLRFDDGNANQQGLEANGHHYRPAYELTEDVEERLGRN